MLRAWLGLLCVVAVGLGCRGPDLHQVEGLPDAGPIELTTRSSDFWLGFMENLQLDANGPPRFSLYLDTDTNTSGTWSMPASHLDGTFAVKQRVQEVPLEFMNVPYDQGSEKVGNFGIHIVTTHAVSLSAVHFRLFFSDSTLVLPTSMLGTEYMVLAVTDVFKLGGSHSLSEFLVVATADCDVTVVPTANTVGRHMQGVPFVVSLRTGQTLQVQSESDLTGSRVTATQPIAVFGGATQTSVECATADSHVWDQLLPTKFWGTRTTVVPFLEQGNSPVKLVAVEDTEVRFGCKSEPVRVRKGESITKLLDKPTVIWSTQPVLVAQLGKSRDCTPKLRGDPTLAVRMPDALWGRVHRLLPLMVNASPNVGQHVADVAYASVIQQGVGKLTLDGKNVTDQLSPLGPNFAGEVNLTSGIHDMESTVPMTGIEYGLGDYDAFSQSLGVECAACLVKLHSLPCED